MTRNVTLNIDEELLIELRHRAADAKMSLAAWITSVLESHVRKIRDLELARERALKRLDSGFHLGGAPLSREDCHAG